MKNHPAEPLPRSCSCATTINRFSINSCFALRTIKMFLLNDRHSRIGVFETEFHSPHDMYRTSLFLRPSGHTRVLPSTTVRYLCPQLVYTINLGVLHLPKSNRAHSLQCHTQYINTLLTIAGRERLGLPYGKSSSSPLHPRECGKGGETC